jgi:hypothetical protein
MNSRGRLNSDALYHSLLALMRLFMVLSADLKRHNMTAELGVLAIARGNIQYFVATPCLRTHKGHRHVNYFICMNVQISLDYSVSVTLSFE